MTKIIDRELVKRIIGTQPSLVGGGGGSDFDPSVLTGYATELWVDQNYISIEFFSRLFQAHGTENGQQTDITPNDMDSTITSIEALFGFWTDLYISALGNGGSIGSSIYLSTLADVQLSSPSTGQVLTYNATTGKWVNANAATPTTSLSALSDVTLGTLAGGQVLLYDAMQSKWINSALKTINGQSLLGSGDISVGGGASGNYLPLAGGTMVGATYYGGAYGSGSNSGNARMGRFDHNHGVVLQLGSGGVFDVINSSWNASYFSLRDDSTIRFGNGLDFSDGNGNFLFPFVVSTSLQYSGWHSVFADANNRGILFGVRSGKPAIGTLGGSSLFIEPDVGIGYADPICKLHVNGSICSSSASSFGFVMIGGPARGQVDENASIEFLSGLGHLDWHYNASSADYTSRIIEDTQGVLHFVSTGAVIDNSLGVGTASPSYKLHVAGTIYATGAITALSDVRKKDITGEAGVTVEQIAHAPAVQFLWKGERAKEGLQVGTLAQYWQGVLPEVVINKGGELSMQYGVAALVSAIITARKVVDHERRIQELEKENQDLRREISNIRVKTNIHMRGGIG